MIWRKCSSNSQQLQLLIPKAGRQELFLAYHASLFGGHLAQTRTLAKLSHRFYWSGMSDDVGEWLRQCTICMKRKSPTGRHHPLGNIPTGHRWDRIAMDILDVCDPTPDGYRYILVIDDYFSKWTEAFPIKDKCADTVADVLVNKIILRFGMPLVIHSDQGREFENGLMKSQDVNTDELRAHREHDVAPYPFATWVRDALEVAYDHVRHTPQRTAARRKRLYDVKAVNRKFPVGSWVLCYYPPAAQKKLGSPWVGPQQVVRQATGHTVGIQRGLDTPIIFIHVDVLKMCPTPATAGWIPGPSTAKSSCASTVAFRPGSVVSDSDSTPSVIVSTCDNASHASTRSAIRCKLDDPIDLTNHILSSFFVRDFYYQGCRFHSIAHLICFCYAVLHGLRLFATSVRKWTRHLTDFPTSRFQTPDWQVECRAVLAEIYSHLCLSDMAVKTALIDTGPRPFCLQCSTPWGGLCDTASAISRGNLINHILIDTRVQLTAGKLRSAAALMLAAYVTFGLS